MNPKPYFRLDACRLVDQPELPADFARFFSWHEGIGLDASWYDASGSAHEVCRTIRLCRLDQVVRIGWSSLHSANAEETPQGWEDFAAFRIGVGMYFEEIVYVLSAPSCPLGSILALMGLAPGPGGTGPYVLEPSLVLAQSFEEWLRHLQRWNWVEYSIAGIGDLPTGQQEELLRYYLTLNPTMNVTARSAGKGVRLGFFDTLSPSIQVADPLGHTTKAGYDAIGNVVSSTDGMGNTSYQAYDKLGRLIQTVDARRGVTRRYYDAESNLIRKRGRESFLA